MAASLGNVRSAWMNGLREYDGDVRSLGGTPPDWIYVAESIPGQAAFLFKLFRDDRGTDLGLQCLYGDACRDCPILERVERSMLRDKADPDIAKFRTITEDDIDQAKAWTCIGHIALAPKRFYWGEGIVHTRADREDRAALRGLS